MTRVIVKPDGHAVTLGEYVRSWRALLNVSPEIDIAGWSWFPVSARSILCDIREGIHDRINQRGHLLLQPTRRALPVGLRSTVALIRDLEIEQERRAFRRAHARANVRCRFCNSPMSFSNVRPRICGDCK